MTSGDQRGALSDMRATDTPRIVYYTFPLPRTAAAADAHCRSPHVSKGDTRSVETTALTHVRASATSDNARPVKSYGTVSLTISDGGDTLPAVSVAVR